MSDDPYRPIPTDTPPAVDGEDNFLFDDVEVDVHIDMSEEDAENGRDPWELTEEKAESYVRAYGYWSTQRVDLTAKRDRELEKIHDWYTRESERLDRRQNWLETVLKKFLWESKAKTIRLIHGTLGRRKGVERVEIADESTFTNEQIALDSWGYIRQKTTYSPNKKAIKDAITGGAVFNGVELIRSPDSFTITTTPEKE